MEQVEIEIVVQTTTARFGSLAVGDIVRTDAEFAAHLVDDCGAARYVRSVASAAAAEINIQTSVDMPIAAQLGATADQLTAPVTHEQTDVELAAAQDVVAVVGEDLPPASLKPKGKRTGSADEGGAQ